MTARLLVQYRVAFGLVLLGIVLAIGVVVRAAIELNAPGAATTDAAEIAALAGGRIYVDVAITVIIIGMILGVVTTLQSQSPTRR